MNNVIKLIGGYLTMNVRKILIVLAVLFVISATGCNSSKDSTVENISDNDVVQLTILTHFFDQIGSEFDKYIDEWNKNNPKIQVKQNVVDYNELLKTISAQNVSGQQSDIIHAYSLWGNQLTQNEVLSHVPDEIKKDIEENYPAASVEGSKAGDQFLGYPTEVETYALFYNKKLLKEAGYSDPPNTWDELYTMAEDITQKKDG